MGYHTAVLDADITGPSIPKIFGVHTRPEVDARGMIPPVSKMGTDIMSVNLLLEKETSPVVWRGPVIAGVVQQFWTDCVWNDVDFMFVDMPPGTGDVPLTVFQSLPVDGVVIVSTPQKLVSMIVEKAVTMAQLMDVPVLGLVENMSYFKCPDCGKEYDLFGKSDIEETARMIGGVSVSRIPIDPALAGVCDDGLIELFEGDWLDKLAEQIAGMLPQK
jgi:Mrp family chromosome partitioning ATPase